MSDRTREQRIEETRAYLRRRENGMDDWEVDLFAGALVELEDLMLTDSQRANEHLKALGITSAQWWQGWERRYKDIARAEGREE